VAGSTLTHYVVEYGPGQTAARRPASIAKQYNVTVAEGRRRSTAGKVTGGMAESNGSLQPGVGGHVACKQLTIPNVTDLTSSLFESVIFSNTEGRVEELYASLLRHKRVMQIWHRRNNTINI